MEGIDFGKRSGDYAEHRPGFPASFFDRIARLAPVEGAAALDVGTGPGIIALDLAKRGARVTGVDVAENQIHAATARAADLGLTDRCTFEVASAERTGQSPGSFDLATAGQCWHWFDETAAMAELMRVLKPGGVLAVANYCYLPRHSEVAAATEDLILAFNPTWPMAGVTGVFPEHIDALIDGGFEFVEQFCYDVDQPFSHAAWRGRMRTCNGVGSGTLSERGVRDFDSALAALLANEFPQPTLQVAHRVWATVVRRPRS